MFPELTQRLNEEGAILAPYHSLVKPNGTRSFAQGFDAFASTLSFVSRMENIKSIVIPVAAMWADKPAIRPIVALSRRMPIYFVPVYRREEQSDPGKNPLGLAEAEMKARNTNYLRIARESLDKPGHLVVISPYGIRQTPKDSPRIKNGFLELATSGGNPVVLATSGLKGVGFETVFHPNALDLTTKEPSDIRDQFRVIYTDLWNSLRY